MKGLNDLMAEFEHDYPNIQNDILIYTQELERRNKAKKI